MMKLLALLASATTVAGHASYMLEAARCSRDISVGANIMGVSVPPLEQCSDVMHRARGFPAVSAVSL